MLKIKNSSRGSLAVAFCFHKEQVQSLYFAQVAAACVLACPDQQDSISARDGTANQVLQLNRDPASFCLHYYISCR